MDNYPSGLKYSVKKFIDHDTPRKVQFMDTGEKRSLPDEVLTDDGYCVVDSITEPIYEDQHKFQYKINAEGFRSQHFKTLDKDSTNILYAGCSMTYGVGLPEEYTWHSLLTSLIKERLHPEVESFNVASPGASIHEIVRNCFIFFEKYGNPDYLFISVSDIERSISFDNSDEKFKQIIPSEFNLTQKMSKQLIYALSSINTANNWLLCADIMFMLESYCKSAGIKLVWTSWVRQQADDWDSLKFANYLKTEDYNIRTWYSPITGEEKPDGLEDNADGLPYWDYARDGSHPGLLWSRTVSKKFIDEIEKRWFE
jgi:hypothetical protein